MAVSSYPTAPGYSRAPADLRWLRVLLGLLVVGLGVVLVVDPRVAVATLALVAGLSLIVHGIHDIVRSGAHRPTTVIAGTIWVAAGVVALAWPDVTVWALAVITGLTCLAAGCLQILTGWLVRGEPHWGWAVVVGVVSVLVGILALVWPGATVAVLSVLLGLRAILAGAGMVAAALVEQRRPALA